MECIRSVNYNTGENRVTFRLDRFSPHRQPLYFSPLVLLPVCPRANADIRLLSSGVIPSGPRVIARTTAPLPPDPQITDNCCQVNMIPKPLVHTHPHNPHSYTRRPGVLVQVSLCVRVTLSVQVTLSPSRYGPRPQPRCYIPFPLGEPESLSSYWCTVRLLYPPIHFVRLRTSSQYNFSFTWDIRHTSHSIGMFLRILYT